jgi:hypothetical protein
MPAGGNMVVLCFLVLYSICFDLSSQKSEMFFQFQAAVLGGILASATAHTASGTRDQIIIYNIAQQKLTRTN